MSTIVINNVLLAPRIKFLIKRELLQRSQPPTAACYFRALLKASRSKAAACVARNADVDEFEVRQVPTYEYTCPRDKSRAIHPRGLLILNGESGTEMAERQNRMHLC